MAERRMFAKTIIDSDAFLDMPITARLLYYDLSMRADDDGFVNSPKKIMRMIGASQDDLAVLALRKFVIPFESGVVVIKHWRVHNYIRKDTYSETKYKEEKALLELGENNEYRQRSVDGPSTQDRLGKDRLGKVIDTGSDSFLSCPSSRAGAGEENAEIVENSVENFIHARWAELSPEVFREGARLTGKLFPRWCGRNYTQEDEYRVAACVERYGAELVMYAFEQALQNGKPGNWNYINGILRKLESRGIDSLEQAEDFDGER